VNEDGALSRDNGAVEFGWNRVAIWLPRPKLGEGVLILLIKGGATMAKRKRKPGGGSKLHPVKEYRDDEYVPYIMSVETGILQAWAVNPDLRDGDVREALRGLMSPMKKTGQLPEQLTRPSESATTPPETAETATYRGDGLLQAMMMLNLRQAFKEHGPLNTEDTLGILTVVNNSVGTWNRGMRGQEYLKYIKDFLGGLGSEVRVLSDEEVKRLGLDKLEHKLEN
jgi:hypothetical protein